jgi:hypothetical protein
MCRGRFLKQRVPELRIRKARSFLMRKNIFWDFLKRSSFYSFRSVQFENFSLKDRPQITFYGFICQLVGHNYICSICLVFWCWVARFEIYFGHWNKILDKRYILSITRWRGAEMQVKNFQLLLFSIFFSNFFYLLKK